MFHKHLATKNHYFMVDLMEGDENANTKMYSLDGTLISDNYHANQFLYEILAGETDEEIVLISEEMLYNQKQIQDENNNL